MKRQILLLLIGCMSFGLFVACDLPEIHVQPGNTTQQENDDENGLKDVVDTSDDAFIYMRPTEAEMKAIEVLNGADFSTISMEALQGYWYCDEGYGYEIFVEVVGDTATIRETVDGVTQEVWYGSGPAKILPPGESGWKNPGLSIDSEDGSNIALIVLRRIGDGYFTTANSGIYYKVNEK